MNVTPDASWEDLDDATRAELDSRYLRELNDWGIHGLGDDGVRVYLDYRRERPGAAITTYEEGRVRKLLQPFADPSQRHDPVAEEEHLDPLEVYGARRFHFTNQQTYLAVMLGLTFLAMIAFVIWVIAGW